MAWIRCIWVWVYAISTRDLTPLDIYYDEPGCQYTTHRSSDGQWWFAVCQHKPSHTASV